MLMNNFIACSIHTKLAELYTFHDTDNIWLDEQVDGKLITCII